MPKASLAELLAEAATGVYRVLLGNRRAQHLSACLHEHREDVVPTAGLPRHRLRNNTLKYLLCCRKHPAQDRNTRMGYEEGIGVVT